MPSTSSSPVVHVTSDVKKTPALFTPLDSTSGLLIGFAIAAAALIGICGLNAGWYEAPFPPDLQARGEDLAALRYLWAAGLFPLLKSLSLWLPSPMETGSALAGHLLFGTSAGAAHLGGVLYIGIVAGVFAALSFGVSLAQRIPVVLLLVTLPWTQQLITDRSPVLAFAVFAVAALVVADRLPVTKFGIMRTGLINGLLWSLTLLAEPRLWLSTLLLLLLSTTWQWCLGGSPRRLADLACMLGFACVVMAVLLFPFYHALYHKFGMGWIVSHEKIGWSLRSVSMATFPAWAHVLQIVTVGFLIFAGLLAIGLRRLPTDRGVRLLLLTVIAVVFAGIGSAPVAGRPLAQILSVVLACYFLLAVRAWIEARTRLGAVALDMAALLLAGVFLAAIPAIPASAADMERLELNRAVYQAITDNDEFPGRTVIRLGWENAAELWKLAFWATQDERNFDLQYLPYGSDRAAYVKSFDEAQFVVVSDGEAFGQKDVSPDSATKREVLVALRTNAAFDLIAQFRDAQGRPIFVFKRRGFFSGVRLDQGFLSYEGPFNASEVPLGTTGGRWALGPIHKFTVIRKSPQEDILHMQLRALRDIKAFAVRIGGRQIFYSGLPGKIEFVDVDVPLDAANAALSIPIEISYEGNGHTIAPTDRVVFYAAMQTKE